MHRHYHGRYHSKAQNLRVLLRRAYDDAALQKFDVLAMPTIPFVATPIPPPDAPLNTVIDVALKHAGQHLLVRCFRTSCLHRAMRPRQWFAGWPDAGRASLRRNNTDTVGSGDRSRRRLEVELRQTRQESGAGVRFASPKARGYRDDNTARLPSRDRKGRLLGRAYSCRGDLGRAGGWQDLHHSGIRRPCRNGLNRIHRGRVNFEKVPDFINHRQPRGGLEV